MRRIHTAPRHHRSETIPARPRSLAVLAVLMAGLTAVMPASAEPDKQDFSTAEREVLMSDQL